MRTEFTLGLTVGPLLSFVFLLTMQGFLERTRPFLSQPEPRALTPLQTHALEAHQVTNSAVSGYTCAHPDDMMAYLGTMCGAAHT